MAIHSRRTDRGGMILLLVLGMMTLFAMLVVAFMVVSSQASRAAKSNERHSQVQDIASMQTAFEDTHRGFLEVARGSNNLSSAIFPYSIFENLYGHPVQRANTSGDRIYFDIFSGISGEISSVSADFDGISRLEFVFDEPSSNFEGYLNRIGVMGNVLTFKDTDMELKSVRIVEVEYDPDDFSHCYLYIVHPLDSDLVDRYCFINSAPFSGHGVGWCDYDEDGNIITPNANQPQLFFEDSEGTSLAETPNPTTLEMSEYFTTNMLFINPDHTAPNVQNMFLAWDDGSNVIPSYHRPWLFTGISGLDELRKRSLRPLTEDHPNFDGSNPAYGYNGPYDVDNDRNGIPESVWIYTGAPIRTDRYGKKYVPLYAICIKDMDARVNVNTAGQLTHFEDVIDITSPGVPDICEELSDSFMYRGSGFGVSDIRLDVALAQIGYGNSDAALGRLLFGTANIPGRFGFDYQSNSAVSAVENRRSGNPLGSMNVLDYAQFYGEPQTGIALDNTAYFGSIPDFTGSSVLAYDHLGHRFFYPYVFDSSKGTKGEWGGETLVYDQGAWEIGTSGTGDDFLLKNSPYLLDPYNYTVIDKPFTSAEFEALLRPYDADSGALPQRLLDLLDEGSGVSNNVKNHLTTLSSDIPSPNRRIGIDSSIYSRMYRLVSNTLGASDPELENVTNDLIGRLPTELRQGLKIDVNRLTRSPTWPTALNVNTSASNINSTTNDSDHVNGLIERAEYAQGIYLFLLALSHDHIDVFSDNDPKKRALICARLAQWSVNLVDYADPDAVQTPLLYDINPFNGWDSIANMANFFDSNEYDNLVAALNSGSSDVRLTFGMERPDLVMTETFATHQRNVADTKWDSTTNKYSVKVRNIGKESEEPDPDFDQVRMPQASTWIELYCTASPNQPYYPPELYTGDLIDLERMTPDGGSDLPSYPVWRVAVGESTDPMREEGASTRKSENTLADPENSVVNRLWNSEDGMDLTFSFQPQQFREGTVTTPGDDPLKYRSSIIGASSGSIHEIPLDRIVWLCKTAPTDKHYDSKRIFWNRNANAKLEPNSYLVITPRLTTFLGSRKCKMGERTSIGDSEKLESTDLMQLFGVPTGIGIDFSSANAGFYTDVKENPIIAVCASELPEEWSVTTTNGKSYGYLGEGIEDYGIGFNISAPLSNDGSFYEKPGVKNTILKLFDNSITFDIYDGYCDAAGGTTTTNLELEEKPDGSKAGKPLSEDFLVGEGTVPCYKSAFLQRVADPLRAYDPVTNPYLTVDWNMLDLTVFLGESVQDSTDPSGYTGQDEASDITDTGSKPALLNSGRKAYKVGSRKWNDLQKGSNPNPWMRVLSDISKPESDLPTNVSAESDLSTGDFKYLPVHSFGRYDTSTALTWWDKTKVAADGVGDVYLGAPLTPFIHLPWNDAPYANPFEIIQVPASAPGRFGVEFVDQGTSTSTSLYSADSIGMQGRFGYNVTAESGSGGSGGDETEWMGHQLNFFHSSKTSGESLNLAQFLEFVNVPSRFTGTKTWFDTSSYPPVGVSNFREPGKINLNTMQEPSWEALTGNRDGTTYSTIESSRGADFENPFRSATAANLSERITSNDPSEVTMLRKSGTSPLLGSTNSNKYGTYNELEAIQRLSNMTTTRSNVFAVWVTVGYFEVTKVNPADYPGYTPTQFYSIYPEGYTFGKELGYYTGDVVRHRAFYLIDRSIPIGFRRGENNNIEDAILIKRVLE